MNSSPSAINHEPMLLDNGVPKNTDLRGKLTLGGLFTIVGNSSTWCQQAALLWKYLNGWFLYESIAGYIGICAKED